MINLESIAPEWPVVKGDYVVGAPESRIAVVTLASTLESYPDAAIWGTCKTENLGAEKIIANIISNSNIRYILICGGESRGHLAGQTLLALHKSGIDEHGRIIGSDGAIPFIENISKDAIERFQSQVKLIAHIGLTDLDKIQQIVDEVGVPAGETMNPGQALTVARRAGAGMTLKQHHPRRGDVQRQAHQRGDQDHRGEQRKIQRALGGHADQQHQHRHGDVEGEQDVQQLRRQRQDDHR